MSVHDAPHRKGFEILDLTLVQGERDVKVKPRRPAVLIVSGARGLARFSVASGWGRFGDGGAGAGFRTPPVLWYWAKGFAGGESWAAKRVW